MSAYAYLNQELDVNFNARVLRATLGVGLVGTFLTGILVTPIWVFTASVLAIYLVTSAILDKDILHLMYSGREAAEQPTFERNLNGAVRMVRAATAGVALGGVLGDALIEAYLLDAFGIFALNTVGVYLAMTSIMGWDPVNALFGAGPPPVKTLTPSTVRPISGSTQKVAEPQPLSKRRAA